MDNGVEDQDSSFPSKLQYVDCDTNPKLKSLLKSNTEQTKSQQDLSSK